jgi:hypothetical protein
MALVLLDRAQETATANTTVSFTLLGASDSYQSLAGVGNTNTTYYGASDGTNWEVGVGTYSTTGPTLTRTTILSSSNANAAVTFSGTVTVFVDYPASQSVYENESGVVFVPYLVSSSIISSPIIGTIVDISIPITIPSNARTLSYEDSQILVGGSLFIPVSSVYKIAIF